MQERYGYRACHERGCKGSAQSKPVGEEGMWADQGVIVTLP
jgi:hypothetical protein